METRFNPRELYARLADGYERRGQPQFRDRFLVLAADAALRAGDSADAERWRQRLLAVNPHHMLKPYATFAQAMQAADVQLYVADLRKNYPPEVGEGLLRSLNEADEPSDRLIPVTAPLLNLGGERDLLMDDDPGAAPIFPIRDDSRPAIPPTLPPEQFPRMSESRKQSPPPARSARPSRHEEEVPATLVPGAARPLPRPIPAPAAPKPKPAAPAKPASRPVAKIAQPPKPRPKSPTAPAPEPAENDRNGAWFAALLFGVVLVGGLALAAQALLLPFFGRQN